MLLRRPYSLLQAHRQLLGACSYRFLVAARARVHTSVLSAFTSAAHGRQAVRPAEARWSLWSYKNTRSTYNSEKALWEKFFEAPEEWWDKRQCKRGSRSPDFTHRTRYWGLWVKDRNGVEKWHVTLRLRELDSRETPHKPLIPPTSEEAWVDLWKEPWKYKDVRKTKSSPDAPDFREKATNLGLWLNSAPEWVQKNEKAVLDHLKEGSIVKPKLEMPGLGGEGGHVMGSEQDDELLVWSDAQRLMAIDKLLDFMDHDLSAEAEPPQDVMQSGLMQHQRQGLAWMLAREAEGGPAGGLLADEQGLGKTMQALALIASSPRPTESTPGGEVASASGQGDAELSPAGTLIIVPKSLLDQWAADVSAWTNLRVLIYRDTARERSQEQGLADYDIVMASYGVLRWDSPSKQDKALFKCDWWRVILDEAQYVKGHKTQTAASASLLSARYRWLLSGTPLQNSPEEAFSYLHFLQYEPFCELAAFKNLFKEKDIEIVTRRLREVLQPIMLRRTKASRINGQLVLNLPKMLSTMHPVRFSAEEAAFYRQVEDGFKGRLTAIDSRDLPDGDLLAEEPGDLAPSKRATALAAIHRLRRACDHPWLVSKSGSMEVPNLLGPEAMPCSGADMDEVFTDGSNDGAFPAGHQGVKEASSRSGSDDEVKEIWDEGTASTFVMSAKLHALMDIVRQHSGTDKILVFSDWTDMLDACECALELEGWAFERLDGQMSSKQRESAVAAFGSNPETRIFLVSLRAAGEGLNLAMASRVVLMEPSWNPSQESQAIARAHRFKQTKPVHVHRLFVPGTIEDKILELQNYKNKMVNIIIDNAETMVRGQSNGTAGFGSISDLEYLLGLTSNTK